MKKIIIVLLAIFIPSLLCAEPIYLDCNVSGEKGNVSFSVKLDESTSQVTHSFENGMAQHSEGFYMANKITYKIYLHSLFWIYEINRTTLNVTQSYGKDDTVTVDGGGKCNIVNIKKRKI